MMPTKSKNNIVLLFFEKQNENGGMNLQKTQENTKEPSSKSQKLKFVMTFVSSCQHKFSIIGSTR
jgi:hypothetical protein